MRARGLGPVYQCDPEPKAQWLVEHAGVPREWIVRAHDFPAPQPMHWTEWWLAIAMLTSASAAATAAGSGRRADRCRAAPVRGRAGPRGLRALACRRAVGAGDPLVLIQAGNKRTLKRGRRVGTSDAKYWPPQRWGALARGVLEALPARARVADRRAGRARRGRVDPTRRRLAARAQSRHRHDRAAPACLARARRQHDLGGHGPGARGRSARLPADGDVCQRGPALVAPALPARACRRAWAGAPGRRAACSTSQVPQVLAAGARWADAAPGRRVRLLKLGKSGRILRPAVPTPGPEAASVARKSMSTQVSAEPGRASCLVCPPGIPGRAGRRGRPTSWSTRCRPAAS